MIIDLQTVSVVGGILGVLCGGVATWMASKSKALMISNAQIIENQTSLIALARDEKEQWKRRYDDLHAEGVRARDVAHKRLDAANVTVLTLTNEVAELRARTDVTPMIEHIEKQGEVTKQILTALTDVTCVLRELEKKLNK